MSDPDFKRQLATSLIEHKIWCEQHRQRIASHERRIDGLARVLVRESTPVGPDQADQIADVFQEAGDISHSEGSRHYETSGALRAAAKKHRNEGSNS